MGRTRRAADAAGWRFFSGWGFATAPSLALAELGHLLHILIADKLQDGRLPRNSVPRVLGGPGKGEACDACGASIAKEQLGIEGIALAAGGGSSRGVTDRRRNQFVSLMGALPRGVRRARPRVLHPRCVERRAPAALVVLGQLEVEALACASPRRCGRCLPTTRAKPAAPRAHGRTKASNIRRSPVLLAGLGRVVVELRLLHDLVRPP